MVLRNSIALEAGNENCYLEGWAIDSKAECAAEVVYIQVSDQYYFAEYGKERHSLSEALEKTRI